MALDRNEITPAELTTIWEEDWGVQYASRIKFIAEGTSRKLNPQSSFVPLYPVVVQLECLGSVLASVATALKTRTPTSQKAQNDAIGASKGQRAAAHPFVKTLRLNRAATAGEQAEEMSAWVNAGMRLGSLTALMRPSEVPLGPAREGRLAHQMRAADDMVIGMPEDVASTGYTGGSSGSRKGAPTNRIRQKAFDKFQNRQAAQNPPQASSAPADFGLDDDGDSADEKARGHEPSPLELAMGMNNVVTAQKTSSEKQKKAKQNVEASHPGGAFSTFNAFGEFGSLGVPKLSGGGSASDQSTTPLTQQSLSKADTSNKKVSSNGIQQRSNKSRASRDHDVDRAQLEKLKKAVKEWKPPEEEAPQVADPGSDYEPDFSATDVVLGGAQVAGFRHKLTAKQTKHEEEQKFSNIEKESVGKADMTPEAVEAADAAERWTMKAEARRKARAREATSGQTMSAGTTSAEVLFARQVRADTRYKDPSRQQNLSHPAGPADDGWDIIEQLAQKWMPNLGKHGKR